MVNNKLQVTDELSVVMQEVRKKLFPHVKAFSDYIGYTSTRPVMSLDAHNVDKYIYVLPQEPIFEKVWGWFENAVKELYKEKHTTMETPRSIIERMEWYLDYFFDKSYDNLEEELSYVIKEVFGTSLFDVLGGSFFSMFMPLRRFSKQPDDCVFLMYPFIFKDVYIFNNSPSLKALDVVYQECKRIDDAYYRATEQSHRLNSVDNVAVKFQDKCGEKMLTWKAEAFNRAYSRVLKTEEDRKSFIEDLTNYLRECLKYSFIGVQNEILKEGFLCAKYKINPAYRFGLKDVRTWEDFIEKLNGLKDRK